MKTETLLLLAAAAGAGYLLYKHHKSEVVKAAVTGTVNGTPMVAKALPEEGAEVILVEPDVEYVPAWGGSWGPSWGGWRRGGGGGGHHHGGGRRH